MERLSFPKLLSICIVKMPTPRVGRTIVADWDKNSNLHLVKAIRLQGSTELGFLDSLS